MSTNISSGEQKDKWFALRKAALTEELLQASPKDFQERNRFYQLLSIFLSYPLQLISILAGSYLLYELFQFMTENKDQSMLSWVIFTACVLVFVGIESFRRWLVNTTGYNYITTFRLSGTQLKPGEWLKTNFYLLSIISLILILTGTLGMYQYIKRHSPVLQTIQVESIESPWEEKVQEEKAHLRNLDQDIRQLINAKSEELKDTRSYGFWQGKEYLLSEVKERHQQYDQQITQMQKQREMHQEQIRKYEEEKNLKVNQTEIQNATSLQVHSQNKEWYASITAGVWFVFEALLLLMLSYPWAYLFYSKRERLLEKVYALESNNNSKINPLENHSKLKSSQDFVFSPKRKMNGVSQTQNITSPNEIGFKWQELDPVQENKAENKNTIIVKEVPVIQKVFVDREVIRQKKSPPGFEVTCAYCGKKEMKKRPAKFCSSTCRNKSWKEKN